MPTEIFNDGACIRILSNNNTLLLSKLQIKTIDTVRTDTVRIDIGEGALKNIYIRFDEVVTPRGLINADDLRDYINNFLTSSVSGGATETKQDTQITLLTQVAGLLTDIKAMVGRYTGGGGKGSPLRIDESNPSEIYNGYATAGALTGDPVWGIERVTRRGDVISYTWADGNENFDNVWDDRLTLNYLPI
jgi:hypothetical protein